MSENDFHDPDLPPPQDTRMGSDVGDQPLTGSDRSESSLDPRAGQIRHLYAGKFAVPEALRAGAIAHRFGADDVDALHAAKLKAVQNSAFLRSVWMANAVDNDLDIADPKHQWGLFVNGITDDLQLARDEAKQAGIDSFDIDGAEAVGSGGAIWEGQPAHRLLGRLEQLSHELYDAEIRITDQNQQLEQVRAQLDTATALAGDLRKELRAAEHTMSELLGEIVDHGWLASRDRHSAEATPPWLDKLGEVNATLAAANIIDTAAAQLLPDKASAPGTGAQISDAIAAALTDPEIDSELEPPYSVSPSDALHPRLDRTPEVEP